MILKDLIKANRFLIEDYKNVKEENKILKEENKILKEENKILKEKLNNKKRKFEELEKDEKKEKVLNYMIGTSVEYIISKLFCEYNDF
jgi:regulator of replication initiation timing